MFYLCYRYHEEEFGLECFIGVFIGVLEETHEKKQNGKLTPVHERKSVATKCHENVQIYFNIQFCKIIIYWVKSTKRISEVNGTKVGEIGTRQTFFPALSAVPVWSKSGDSKYLEERLICRTCCYGLLSQVRIEIEYRLDALSPIGKRSFASNFVKNNALRSSCRSSISLR